MLWAIAMTGFAFMVFRDSHGRVKSQRADFERTEELLQGQIQTYTNEKVALQRDLLSGKIIHEELGVLFQQLLYEQHRPKSGSELLSSYDRLFYQVSGKTLTREERAELMETTNRLWGDGTVARAPTPEKDLRTPKGLVPGPETQAPNAGQVPRAARPSSPPVVAPPARPKGQPYSNKAFGYSALFPEGWKVRGEVAASTVMASSPRENIRDQFVADVLISAGSLKQPVELHEFAASQVKSARRSWSAFEVLKEGDLTISGQPARFVECGFDRAGERFKAIKIFVVRPQFAYELTFSSTESTYSRFQETFSAIYSSVKFL